MRYTVRIHMESGRTGFGKLLGHDATIVGLLECEEDYQLWRKWGHRGENREEVRLYFGHLIRDFDDCGHPVLQYHEFYGGLGEGNSYKTWQDAIHASLYDEYQCNKVMRERDEFSVEYQGETALFRCEGVHVIRVAE